MMFGLFEPKVFGSHADAICKEISFDNWVRVEAFGYNMGIWIFWQNSILVDIIATHPQFVFLKVHDRRSPAWLVCFVYGSPMCHLRRNLWDDLKLRNFHSYDMWIVLGNFNCVLSADEVSNYHTFSLHNALDFAGLFSKRS